MWSVVLRGAVIGAVMAAAAVTPSLSQAPGVTPVRPSDTGLLLSPPPREWPEDTIDRFSKEAEAALARCDEASFNFWRAALTGVTQYVVAMNAYDGIANPLWPGWFSYLLQVENWQYIPKPVCPQPSGLTVPNGPPFDTNRSNPPTKGGATPPGESKTPPTGGLPQRTPETSPPKPDRASAAPGAEAVQPSNAESYPAMVERHARAHLEQTVRDQGEHSAAARAARRALRSAELEVKLELASKPGNRTAPESFDQDIKDTQDWIRNARGELEAANSELAFHQRVPRDQIPDEYDNAWSRAQENLRRATEMLEKLTRAQQAARRAQHEAFLDGFLDRIDQILEETRPGQAAEQPPTPKEDAKAPSGAPAPGAGLTPDAPPATDTPKTAEAPPQPTAPQADSGASTTAPGDGRAEDARRRALYEAKMAEYTSDKPPPPAPPTRGPRRPRTPEPALGPEQLEKLQRYLDGAPTRYVRIDEEGRKVYEDTGEPVPQLDQSAPKEKADREAETAPRSRESAERSTPLKSLLASGAVRANVANDGETFCTFGKADPSSVVFVPTDDSRSPSFPTIEIGDPPRAGDAPQPSRNEQASSQKQTGGDGDDVLVATPGGDVMTGGKGDDKFEFRTNPRSPGDRLSGVTLDNGDRITDYEPFEKIWIDGAQLNRDNVQIHYDPIKDETRVQIHFYIDPLHPDYIQPRQPNPNPDRTIILNGKVDGEAHLVSECCSGGASATTLQIGVGELPKPDLTPSVLIDGKRVPRSAGTVPPTPQPEPLVPARDNKSAPQPEKSVPNEKADGGVQSRPQAKEPAEKSTSQNPVPLDANMGGGTITVRFKATEAALQAGSQATELAGERLKVTALQDQPLPGVGTQSRLARDKGFDKSPVTCTTGPDGQCQAEIVAEERVVYGFPASGPIYYRADLTLGKTNGAVIQKAGVSQADLPITPSGAIVSRKEFKIGEKTFTRFDIKGSSALLPDVMTAFSKTFGDLFQIDYCIIVQPGPPLNATPMFLNARPSELPEAAIKLPRIVRAGATSR